MDVIVVIVYALDVMQTTAPLVILAKVEILALVAIVEIVLALVAMAHVKFAKVVMDVILAKDAILVKVEILALEIIALVEIALAHQTMELVLLYILVTHLIVWRVFAQHNSVYLGIV